MVWDGLNSSRGCKRCVLGAGVVRSVVSAIAQNPNVRSSRLGFCSVA